MTDYLDTPLKAPIKDRGGQVLNVMAYGAVGDGVTDDTAAIQAALTAATVGSTQRRGNSVYLPYGDYKITSTLTVSDVGGFSLRGAGPDGVRLFWYGDSSSPLLRIGSSQDGDFGGFSIRVVSGLPLAAAVQVITESGTGYGSKRNSFSKIWVEGIPQTGELVKGFRVGGSPGVDGNNDFAHFRDCIVSNYSDCGWSLENTQVYDVLLQNCFAIGYALSGTASITSGSATLTTTESKFTSGQVGRAIRIPGAGAAGATLSTYISAYTSPTEVTLATAASTTVVGASALWHGLDTVGLATYKNSGKGGNFHWIGGAMAHNGLADFYLGDPTSTPSSIAHATFEGSSRLVQTAGPSGAEHGLSIDGVRFSGDYLHQDGVAILFKFPGPLVINRSKICEDTSKAAKIKMDPGGVAAQRVYVVKHCIVAGSLSTAAGIFGTVLPTDFDVLARTGAGYTRLQSTVSGPALLISGDGEILGTLTVREEAGGSVLVLERSDTVYTRYYDDGSFHIARVGGGALRFESFDSATFDHDVKVSKNGGLLELTPSSASQDSPTIRFHSRNSSNTDASVDVQKLDGGALTVQQSSDAIPVLAARALTGAQTGNLFEAQTNTGSVLTKVGPDGRVYARTPNSAPTDADIAQGQVTLYLNEAGNELKFRVRYAGGTYKTGTVALT